MTATNFNTENRTYRQLVGNGLVYTIPRFQRDYSWGEEEWEDLWLDMLSTLKQDGEPAHYMGYLVLQTTDNRKFEVIDGQQRLTTMSLIVLASMRVMSDYATNHVNEAANQQRIAQLRATYIGYLDPVTLSSHNKLKLNRNNDPYYRNYLVPLTKPLPVRGFPVSTHQLRKGFEWFKQRLHDYTKDEPDQGVALAQFVESMSDRLFFTVITVADQLNAFKVFETLNARGVRLSATDLLKNYLFSVLAQDGELTTDMDDFEDRWVAMVDRLGSEELPDFLRAHWNSRHNFARHAELFKVIRQRINYRADVFALVRDMEADIDTYLALSQPEGSEWPDRWRQNVQHLRMFAVRQPFPMLMAAKRMFSEAEFGDLLRVVVVIAFRYNVIGGQNPAEQERTFHATALALNSGRARVLRDVVAQLRAIYPNDDAFRTNFADKSIKTKQSRNAQVVRYILAMLEKQDNGLDLNLEEGYTIEHILPQKPGPGWESFPENEVDLFAYRLANMVLLEKSKNQDIGNLPFDEKRIIMKDSSVLLTRQLAEAYDTWTPEKLVARQKKLAKVATTVWRIDQLS